MSHHAQARTHVYPLPFTHLSHVDALVQRRFLDHLRKALVATKSALTDTAIRCFVDIVVASTYVAKKTTASCLRHMVPPIEQELKDRLLTPAKPYFEGQAPDIVLLTNFMLACFKLSQHSVILGYFCPFINGIPAILYQA